MSSIKIIILLIFASLFATVYPLCGMAQIDVARADLSEIYKSYNRLKYLSFDVAYLYDSDTLKGDFTHNELDGSYCIHDNKNFYKLGDISFMQNDSILVGVYTNKKMIIIGDPQARIAEGAIPIAQMDSLFKMQGKHYAVTVSSKSKNTVISFTGIDSLAQFIKYDITFDNSSDFIKKLEYSFIGITDKNLNDPSISDSTRKSLLSQKRRKRLTIVFSNYSLDKIDPKQFDEKNYVVYKDNVYRPVAKYGDYKVYNTKRKKQVK